MNAQLNQMHAEVKIREAHAEARRSRRARIGSALGKLFPEGPRNGPTGPATPGGEGRLIS